MKTEQMVDSTRQFTQQDRAVAQVIALLRSWYDAERASKAIDKGANHESDTLRQN